jgi:hypothetical protein
VYGERGRIRGPRERGVERRAAFHLRLDEGREIGREGREVGVGGAHGDVRLPVGGLALRVEPGDVLAPGAQGRLQGERGCLGGRPREGPDPRLDPFEAEHRSGLCRRVVPLHAPVVELQRLPCSPATAGRPLPATGRGPARRGRRREPLHVERPCASRASATSSPSKAHGAECELARERLHVGEADFERLPRGERRPGTVGSATSAVATVPRTDSAGLPSSRTRKCTATSARAWPCFRSTGDVVRDVRPGER